MNPHNRPGASSQRMRPNAPQRTTKTTQKLVLFPEESQGVYLSGVEDGGQQQPQPWYAPYNEVVVPHVVPDAARTEAERMSKEQRTMLPRVTSYSMAEGYKINDITKYIERQHGVSTKVYDECLYAFYTPDDKAKAFGRPSQTARPLKMTA
ncbi:hypothetical protein HK104_005833 [Borealophlyctis nickersoniae]|nr:hypothetical protein HK104_005833 [Borealophlyctis nickersoniae]